MYSSVPGGRRQFQGRYRPSLGLWQHGLHAVPDRCPTQLETISVEYCEDQCRGCNLNAGTFVNAQSTTRRRQRDARGWKRPIHQGLNQPSDVDGFGTRANGEVISSDSYSNRCLRFPVHTGRKSSEPGGVFTSSGPSIYQGNGKHASASLDCGDWPGDRRNVVVCGHGGRRLAVTQPATCRPAGDHRTAPERVR